MKVKIKILTPLHIGSGKELIPTEYLIKDSLFHRINMNALFTDPDFQPLMESFIQSVETQRYIGDLLPEHLLRRHILYSLPIVGKAKDYLKNNKTIVKEFIKSAGKVFIPGSSLKGSIFSALFWHSLKEAYVSKRDFITKSLQGEFNYNDLLNFTFSFFTKGDNRFVRWLDVVDSEGKSPSEVLQISLIKVKGARGGALPVLYETIKPGTEFLIEIKAQNTKLTEKEILEIVDRFYRKVLEKDRNAITTNRKLIRLGQGSTAYSTSCLILAEELNIRNYPVRPPTTRKRVDEALPLGWAEILEIND